MSSLVGVKNGEKDAHAWKIAAYHNVDVDPILTVPRSQTPELWERLVHCYDSAIGMAIPDGGSATRNLVVGPRS